MDRLEVSPCVVHPTAGIYITDTGNEVVGACMRCDAHLPSRRVRRARYAPGPWTEDPEGTHYVTIEDALGKPVCDVHGAVTDPVGSANARLIAAAPDLLGALKSIEPELRCNCTDHRCDGTCLKSIAYAAIAKAGGDA